MARLRVSEPTPDRSATDAEKLRLLCRFNLAVTEDGHYYRFFRQPEPQGLSPTEVTTAVTECEAAIAAAGALSRKWHRFERRMLEP